jgi:2-amino-4-hydroxy-6-hydroxymethyldihydropteridine diphosphokinase
MAQVFIGLGSNLGNRTKYLEQAVQALAGQNGILIKSVSSVYETEPVGVKEQPQFLNQVVELETTIEPSDLMKQLKTIEHAIGRTETERWGPREIDLDLLYYNSIVYNDEFLRVPHPEIANRRFVLVPMKEIAPSFVDPLRKQTVEELLHHCQDTSTVRKIHLHPETKHKG